MEAPLSSPRAYLLAPVTAVHPPELETDDASLATEILPAPPPLASVSGQRRDPHLRRPSQVFSYLPASDPGSTYSGLMGGLGLSLIPEDDGRLRKRPRIDKTAINNRAQRASARNLTPSAAPSLLSPPDPHPFAAMQPDDPTGLKPRDKGKAREKPPTRVKEEPQTISLDMLEPPSLHPNDDHCSACRSHGALVYCDGCPRAFHLWCLDPPLDSQDVPEHRWYCPACVIRHNPPPKPRRSLLAPLLHQLQTSIPTEFELPEEIRGFFKDVATGPKGAYQDSSETKIVRSSRFVIQDEREPFRLKDRNGAPVLCFRCGKSALPDSDTALLPLCPSTSNTRETRGSRRGLRAPPGEILWKSIASCDHCTLHWHLDCLDPPLSSMPPAHKKWMCPAHVEHIAPKRRVPRQVPPVTDVTERNRPNNGNIEIIPADSGADRAKRMAVDEVHINGRRYRVPERVIVLDFWDKLERGRKPPPTHALLSGLSSPLTSLSSLDGIGPSILPPPPEPPKVVPSAPPPGPDAETMRAVELLFGCRTAVVKNGGDRMDVDHPAPHDRSEVAVQTEPEGCVKLDVNDAKRLSGLISATLQDLDLPESPSPPRTVSRSRVTSISKARAPRPSRPGSLRKSSRLPSDTGSTRVTRSQAAPAAAPTPPSVPLQRSKTESSIAPSLTRTTRSAPRAARSTAGSSVPLPPSTTPPAGTKGSSAPTLSQASRTSKSSAQPAKHRDASVSPSRAFKTEPSGSTAVPPHNPNPTKSPFKIRIPRAINAAVAAATAAAAAASASASSAAAQSQSTEQPRFLRKEITAIESGSDSNFETDDRSPPRARKAFVESSGVAHSNGRRPRTAPRAGMSLQSSSNVGAAAAPSRVTRSAATAPRTPTRPPRDMNPFERSPQYTDITSDSSSDFVPATPARRYSGRRSGRIMTLPRSLEL